MKLIKTRWLVRTTIMLIILAFTGSVIADNDNGVIVVSLKTRNVTLNEFNSYFDVAIKILSRQQGIPYKNQSPEQIASLRRQYLVQLGAEMVLLQEAINRGITVPDEEIDTQAKDFLAGLGDTSLDEVGFMSGEQLRQFLKEKQMIRVLTEQLASEIYIPASDVVTLHHDIQHELMLPARVCLRHLVVEDESTAGGLLSAFNAGGDFETLARENSTDEKSAESGGDLGCFEKGQGGARSDFESVAFNTGVGEVSGPVQSEFGYHLIQVYEYRPERPRTLDQAYELLEKELRHEKLPEKILELRQASELVTYPDRLGG